MGGLSGASGADMMVGVCSGGPSTADQRQFYLSKADAKSGASTYNKIPVTDSAAKFASLTVGETPAAAAGGVKIQKDLFANTVTGQSSVTSSGDLTAGTTKLGGITADSLNIPSSSSTGGITVSKGNLQVNTEAHVKNWLYAWGVSLAAPGWKNGNSDMNSAPIHLTGLNGDWESAAIYNTTYCGSTSHKWSSWKDLC